MNVIDNPNSNAGQPASELAVPYNPALRQLLDDLERVPARFAIQPSTSETALVDIAKVMAETSRQAMDRAFTVQQEVSASIGEAVSLISDLARVLRDAAPGAVGRPSASPPAAKKTIKRAEVETGDIAEDYGSETEGEAEVLSPTLILILAWLVLQRNGKKMEDIIEAVSKSREIARLTTALKAMEAERADPIKGEERHSG